jgi:excisionase family DNA binding protein
MPGEMTIDVRELARRLSCGRSAAYALAASGVLKTVRVGRALRVPESALAAFIEAGGVRVIPGKGHAPTPPPAPAKSHRKRAVR